MDDVIASDRETINRKLRQFYDGKIVRKDLTKHIKEGANVPIYVLEYLLGQYCNSDDEAIIERGVDTVKNILANNYVRPDEAQKVLSILRKKGSHVKYEAFNFRDGKLANENKLKENADYAAYKKAVPDAIPKFKFNASLIRDFKEELMPQIIPLLE